MNKVISLLCIASLLSVSARAQETPQAVRPFPDVPPNHWASQAVEQLRRRGIVRGYRAAPTVPAPAVRKTGAQPKHKPRRR